MGHRVGLSAILLAACGSFGSASDPAAGADAGSAEAAAPDGGTSLLACPRPDVWICEDFERPGGYRFGWQTDNGGGIALLAIEEVAGAPSPSHALHITTPPAENSEVDALLFAVTPAAVTKLTVEAKLRLVAAGIAGSILEIDDAGDASLALLVSGAIEEVYGTEKAHRTPAAIPPPARDEWTPVVLMLDIGTHRGSASLGGATVTFAVDPSWVPSILRLRIGFNDASQEVAWSAYYDDVVVTTE